MKKNILLLLGVLAGCWLVRPDTVFAQSSMFEELFETWGTLLRFLTWVWIVPATIAGKLMTNQFVFGEVFGLNVYLRKVWTLMRTFANFAVVGLFLAYLGSALMARTAVSELLSKCVRLALGAILINASWFGMNVLVDLANIGTAAVSALPLEILSETREQKKYQEIFKTRQENIIKEGGIDSSRTDNARTETIGLQTILPDANNMAGPIVFMGVSLLGFFEWDVIDVGRSGLGSITLMMFVQLMVLIMFIIPILVLLVANAMRIFYIRVWVVVSPLLVLHFVAGVDIGSAKDSLKISQGFSSMIGLIFQPMAVVGALSLGLLLAISFMTVLEGSGDLDERNIALNDLQISGNPSTLSTEVSDVSISGNLFKNIKYQTLGFFGQAILSLLVLMIIWGIVKVSFSFSEATAGVANSILSGGETLLKSLPVIPVFGGQSVNSLSNGRGKQLFNAATGINALKAKDRQDARDFSKKIFGDRDFSPNDLSDDALSELKTAYGPLQKLKIIGEGLKSKSRVIYTNEGNLRSAMKGLVGDDLKGLGALPFFDRIKSREGITTFAQLEKTRSYQEVLKSLATGYDADALKRAGETGGKLSTTLEGVSVKG